MVGGFCSILVVLLYSGQGPIQPFSQRNLVEKVTGMKGTPIEKGSFYPQKSDRFG